MSWFPTKLDTPSNDWAFDIVMLLAVVGGATVEKHRLAITASPYAGLPRLLPAPETFLNTDRPIRLPSVKEVKVIGVHSGIVLTELNFFADVIHAVGDLENYEFRAYTITYRSRSRRDNEAAACSGNLEKNRPQQQQQQQQSPLNKPRKSEPVHVPLRNLCSLDVVTITSSMITAALFVGAGVAHDGVALLGLVCISLSTSAASLSAQWTPQLTTRTANCAVPPGDIVLKTRRGAMIVLRSRYSITAAARCNLPVGGSYILVNVLYWLMALLIQPADIWDLESRYDVKKDKIQRTPSYTSVLWQAILETKSTRWVSQAEFLPDTPYWNEWLSEAQEHIEDPNWDAEAAKDRWMAKAVREHQT